MKEFEIYEKIRGESLGAILANQQTFTAAATLPKN